MLRERDGGRFAVYSFHVASKRFNVSPLLDQRLRYFVWFHGRAVRSTRPLSKWWIDSANLLESEEIVKSTGTGWKGREGGEDEVTYTGWKVGVSESEGDATERPQTGSLQTRQSRARNCYQLCGGGEEYGTVSGRASSLPPPPLS